MDIDVSGNIKAVKEISKPNKSGTVMCLVEFDSKLKVDEVIYSGSKLKGTQIGVERDLPPPIRKRRALMLYIRKKLLSIKPNMKIKVKYDVLYVDDKEYYWDEYNKYIISENKNANPVINELFNCNIESEIEKFFNKETSEV